MDTLLYAKWYARIVAMLAVAPDKGRRKYLASVLSQMIKTSACPSPAQTALLAGWWEKMQYRINPVEHAAKRDYK